VNEVLMGQEVQVRAADVGGNFGRTVLIRVCDGAVFVKQIGGQSNLLSILSRTSDEVAA
jgi:chemotaxis receptor (MCP) glutamine deamidase CheD